VHPPTLQPRQQPQPGFDSVERRQDVEPRDRNIASREARQHSGLRDPRPLPEVGKGSGESAVRFCRLPQDRD
jgi:hypothetical protein